MTRVILPGLLGEMQRAGHGGAALALARAWGGTKRYIPSDPRPGQALVEIVGMPAARWLAEHHGNQHKDIPRAAGLGNKKRAIAQFQGGTREAALTLGCTERYVRMVRNGRRERDERQLQLLD